MRTIFTRFFTMFLGLTLFGSIVMYGQVLPYRHGFEDTAENASWTMVSDNNNTSNTWSIGTATSMTPTHSLYISPDNGTSVGYVDNATTVLMAYREFVFPAGNDTYSVHLDYRHHAQPNDSLFICWVDDPSVTMPTNTNSDIPAWVRTSAKKIEGTASFAWKTASFKVCGGTTGKLVFVWKKHSASPSGTTTTSNIVIDNVLINKNSPIYYHTGFDNPEELEGWSFHASPLVTNTWTAGTQVFLSNPRSLYISLNNSAFSYDGSKEGFVSAVKEFTLPPGEYFNIDFDYIIGGDANDYMYVAWLDNPNDTSFSFWTNNTNFVSPVIQQAAKPTAGHKYHKTPAWTHSAFQVVGKGYPVKLVFYWVNNSNKSFNPPVAIDNFTITRGINNISNINPLPGPCATPVFAEVVTTGGGIVVSWDDDGTSTYQLAYTNTYDTINGLYTVIDDVRSPHTLNALEKGAYSIFVRKFCEANYTDCGLSLNDTSAWATSHQNIILTGDGCINYGDLNNAETVTATYSSSSWSPPATNQAFQNIGVVENRHTLMTKAQYDHNTVDPAATEPGLITVPYGELATVRLGNEETGAQCEGLTYNLHVDPNYVLLIMKYAVVLEDPSHSVDEQPRFKLELLDASNNLISADCGNVLFIPGQNTTAEDGWHEISDGSYSVIKWKNWTTIGLNLAAYAGRNIKIRLSTWDCSQTGHFGYAYFMMNCISAKFSGFSCGEEEMDTIYAPEGFSYCWFKKYNADGSIANTEHDPLSSIACLSTKRGFIPANTADTSTYVCKIMLKTEQGTQEGCYFGITAKLAPRIPDAGYEYELAPENCINYVKFTDNSLVHVGSLNSGQTEIPTGTKWIIRESSMLGEVFARSGEKEPKIEFPPEGGTYAVTLISLPSEGSECADTARFDLTVPPIGDIITNEKITTCTEQLPYMWRGRALNTAGQYEDRVALTTGCDSVFNLEFKVEDRILVEQVDTICHGESLNWEGEVLTATGQYTKEYVSHAGCDSIIQLDLVVNPVMDISVQPFNAPICADDPNFSINYTNAGGSDPTKYNLVFTAGSDFEITNGEYTVATTPSIEIPIPVDIRPDNYSVKIEFEDDRYGCLGTTVDVPFEVQYPSSTIEQNWNDVIAVLNKKYNGGYEFSNYQWYKDGTPIEGETKSYLYVSGGLEVGAEYKVHLTRIGEDYAIYTCAIQAQPYNSTNTPTFMPISSSVNVNNLNAKANVQIYTTTGVLVSSQSITPNNPVYVVPSAAGVYVVNIILDNGIVKHFKIVVGE